ncbi:PREDICTED: uncharacterized protein LOC108575131 [Habropoda laboriosa]|uniref:uncharacterized protein LOC108575131 n=1 Tax=Habropoda laboriosa TaxID=597456 RepID=UPI00083E52D4|nr:PREDICTED: uncharacterized protein LOC108575131 [Habropoda laboriosa]
MAINKILLLLVYCELKLIWSQVVIPKSIRECYRNNATFDSPLPLNLRIIVDIIQKMEKHSTTDMRIMSSSILHRFKFDGIEYQKNVQATDSILPFSGTGMQRTKHRLIEELVPGNLDALPMHVLSQAERCILHQAISNTIVRPDNEDKYKPCGQFIQTEKLTGKIVLTSTWNCPRQQGVILTPYGTVAPGSVIGAIAASLQHQNVAVNHLVARLDIPPPETNFSSMYNLEYNEEEIDFVLPKAQMIHKPSMWYQTLINSPVKLDNVWLTTIAGELAEMVVYQGPLLGNNMTLGATGFWQNTMQPTIYYLTSSYENFDATRSELIGGIDGMIIASYLQTWIQDFYSLRLSQILEMYYSYEGVTFNTNVKACDRAQTFLYAVPKTILNEQTYAIAQMLGYRNSIAYISPEALQRMVDVAIEKFYAYAENHLFPELPCQQQTDRPRIEALIVLDGAWSIDYTIDFLAVLVQDLDVSIYGSKMGIIHGTSGEWLLNVTDSPSLVFQALNNFTNSSWPTQLNYTQVLKTVSTHLNETWEYNRKHHTIGNLGQVVILLTPLGYMSNNDKQFVITLLRQIKNNHPDVHFVYYVSRYNTNLFTSYILSREDHIIKNSNIDSITQYVSTIPRALRPAKFSNLNSSKTLTPQFEDYITPSKSITYRIHSYWKRNMKKTVITIHAFGYGTMKACLWIGFEPTDRQYLQCAELSGYNELALIDHYKCTKASPCPNIYLSIQNVTSLYKCAEMDCKTPDQVRFIIRTSPQNSRYDNSAGKNVMLVSLNILVLFILHAFM